MKQTQQPNPIAVSLVALGMCVFAASHAAAADKPEPPYDLGDLPKGFEVEWPAPPKIDQEVTVHTVQEFNQAAAEDGTSITVDGAIDGTGVISGNDIAVQMSDSGSLGGVRIGRGVERIALNGGQYKGTVEIEYPSTFNGGRVDKPEWQQQDIMMDGISVDGTNAMFLRGKRVALLHSYLHAKDYAIFSDTAKGFQNENVIIADNDIVSEGNQATMRLISARESVTVDNRITSLMAEGGHKHNYRVHGQTDKAFAARNELINAGVMLSTMPGDYAKEIWFNDNTFHHQTPDLFNPSPRNQIGELNVHDNVAYTDVWKCFYCLSPQPGWDISDNTVQPYEAPPSL